MSIIQTKAGEWKIARLTNANDNGFPSRPMLLGRYNSTLFNSDKTHKVLNGNGAAQATARVALWPNDSEDGDTFPNGIQFMPFGADANDEQFSIRWLAWNLVRKPSAEPETWEWNWFKHSEWLVTLCTQTGVAGSVIGTGGFYADTIAAVSNAGNSSTYAIFSPQDNTPGMVTMDLLGATMMEPIFTTGGSAAGCNLLYRWIY